MIASIGRVVFVSLALSAGAAAQSTEPTLLKTSVDWEAYKRTDDRGPVCWAVSQPIAKEPATARRDPVYFLVTSWPKPGNANEPSIVIGYPFRPQSAATVEIGTETFTFFTEGDGAWLKSPQEEQRLIEAMRGAVEMTVKGTSKRGTQTTDTYSLKGVSAALDKLAEDCK